MAEAATLDSVLGFEWPPPHTGWRSTTAAKESPPREATKEGLQRDMYRAYRVYRELVTRHTVADAARTSEPMTLPHHFAPLGIASTSGDGSEIFDGNVVRLDVAREKLSTWLFDTLRNFEEAPSDTCAPGEDSEGLSKDQHETFEEITGLQANWDGQGAARVSPDAIAAAKAFLGSIGAGAASFEPFADPDGSVGLEGHRKDRSAYVVISHSGTCSYVIRDDSRVHRGNNVDVETMRRLLDLLY